MVGERQPILLEILGQLAPLKQNVFQFASVHFILMPYDIIIPALHFTFLTYDSLIITNKKNISYCKTCFFHVPFISRISRAWQVRENNGPRKFEYSSVSV